MAVLRRILASISSSSSHRNWWRCLSSSATNSPPLIYDYSRSSATTTAAAEQSVTLQLLSWGRGASGQLGGGIEEIRIYPAPVCTIIAPPNFSLSRSIPGRLPQLTDGEPQLEVGISCGLFHSGLVVDGKLWIWGKGDGGRLGLGHETSAFVPVLNSNLESNVRSIALGGLHSVALDVLGRVFTWSVPVLALCFVLLVLLLIDL